MLYPEIEPNSVNTLAVSGGHQLYYELSGNPAGIPVLFLHGGPGCGLPLGYQRFFDPNIYHIIGFDQRGCGRSTPHGDTSNNTTADLLSDIQQLKAHLGIKKWVLFGGSWGTTLALLTAINQPDDISALVLRGTFLARKQDFDWYLAPQGGAASLFPDAYTAFIKQVGSKSSVAAICQAYSELLNGSNELKRTSAIRAWYQWEEKISRLSVPSNYSTINLAPLKEMTSMAKLECHYISNSCFLSENAILANINKIASIPGILIHGRYDAICSLSAAHTLHQHWQNSELNIIPNAGHSTAEPGIANALTQATRQVARFVKQKI